MTREPELIDISVTILRYTAKAVLVDAGIGEDVWLPLSQVEVQPDEETVTLPTWLAKDKGII